MPSVPYRRGRPLGSRNKKTLAALAAAAAAASSVTAAAAIGGPTGVTAAAAGLSRCPPTRQPPAYASVNGFVTFLVPILAGSEERLPLPFKFVEAIEGQGLTRAIMEECSGGQPSYDIEVFHNGEGKCYFHGRWPKFFADYGLREGWSLIFFRHNGMCDFCVRVIDGSFCARSFTAWA
jgi:hypothetical protein